MFKTDYSVLKSNIASWIDERVPGTNNFSFREDHVDFKEVSRFWDSGFVNVGGG